MPVFQTIGFGRERFLPAFFHARREKDSAYAEIGHASHQRAIAF